jgi:hypothetical protein
MSEKIDPEVLAAIIRLEMENERLHRQLQTYKDLHAYVIKWLNREVGDDE